MPAIDLSDINYLAVIVAALVTFFLGGLWYSALFARPWQQARGLTPERVKELQGATSMPVFFAVLAVCYLLIAFVLAILVQVSGARSVGEGALLGLLLWLLVAAVGMTGHIASTVKFTGFAVDASYQLLYLIGVCILLAVWR